MANRTIVFLPPNCDNINQAGQGAPNTVLQLPETVLYGGQQLEGPDNQPQRNGQVGGMEKIRYVETKTLGVKCCVGMNITSSIMALIGIVLYLMELCLNAVQTKRNYPNQDNSHKLSYQIGTGLGVLLFLFTSLEFCIAVFTAHFGCLAVCCNNERAITFMQYTTFRGGVNPGEDNPAPPASSAALSSKEEAY
nr:membrane-spanning 4-domains subfamily A member 12-like [Zootoca vivipara]